MENLVKAIAALQTLANASASITEKPSFLLHLDKVDVIKEYLKENGIIYDELLQNEEIDIDKSFYKENNILPYNNFDSFFRRFKILDLDDHVIVILKTYKDDCIILNKNGVVSSRFFSSGEQDLKSLNFYYAKLITESFLPNIADHIDTAHNEYVFLSPECGRFKVVETNLSEFAEMQVSLEDTYIKIKDIIAHPKGWEYLMKNRIIRSLEAVEPTERRFYWKKMKDFLNDDKIGCQKNKQQRSVSRSS
jgi:hypothetical protein